MHALAEVPSVSFTAWALQNCQGMLVVSAGKFAQIPLEIQLFHDKEYFPCLSCPFRLIYYYYSNVCRPGCAGYYMKSGITAFTLQICCQRQGIASRQEKQKAGLEKGWSRKN